MPLHYLLRVPLHELRDATKTAEGIHLVLRALADREEKVTPALDVAELVMVQAVGEEDVVQQAQPWVLATLREFVGSMRAALVSGHEAAVSMRR